jgi:hypothetical protein
MPVALYTVGTAQRPALSHDPGFADRSRPATANDRVLLAGWALTRVVRWQERRRRRLQQSSSPVPSTRYRNPQDNLRLRNRI